MYILLAQPNRWIYFKLRRAMNISWNRSGSFPFSCSATRSCSNRIHPVSSCHLVFDRTTLVEAYPSRAPGSA